MVFEFFTVSKEKFHHQIPTKNRSLITDVFFGGYPILYHSLLVEISCSVHHSSKIYSDDLNSCMFFLVKVQVSCIA